VGINDPGEGGNMQAPISGKENHLWCFVVKGNIDFAPDGHPELLEMERSFARALRKAAMMRSSQ
jgi:hypothetical protein